MIYLNFYSKQKNLLKKIMSKHFSPLINTSYSDFYSVTSKSDKDLLIKGLVQKYSFKTNWIDVNSRLKITQRENYTLLSVGRLEKQKNYKDIILNCLIQIINIIYMERALKK